MAPALKLPVKLDMDGFRQQAKQLNDGVGETLKLTGEAFKRTNAEILGIARETAAGATFAWSQALTRKALLFTTTATVAVASYKLIGAAIRQARSDIEAMVAVADKAQDRQLRPEAYQAFVASAKGAEDQIQKLDDALTAFYNNSKDEIDRSVAPGALDEEKRKWSEIETAVRSAKLELGAVTGPDTFVKASGTDAEITSQRMLGLVQTIDELFKAGQRLEALDLIQKGFGAQLADDVRRGKTDFDDIARTVSDRLVRGLRDANTYSDETVRQAKQLDDRLKDAAQTINQNLHPAFENLAQIGLSIKSVWVEVVELMAKASGYLPGISNIAAGKSQEEIKRDLTAIESEIERLQKAAKDVGSSWTDYLFGGLSAAKVTSQITQLAALQRQAEQLRAALATSAPPAADDTVPLPRRRPLGIPQDTPKAAPGDQRDRFDTTADSIEKRTAAINAETANIDLNTQARERAKIVAELETVAKQANAAAGRGENLVTAEQRARIDEVADAYGRAQGAIEKARSPLATFARESQNVDKALNQFATSSLESVGDQLIVVGDKTQTLADRFRSMANSIINDLLRIAVRKTITGPLAQGLNSLFSPEAVGQNGGAGLSANAANPSPFEKGGYTGDGDEKDVAGVVHGKEFVFDAEATSRIGPANLEALRRNKRGYATGGYVGPQVIAAPVVPQSVAARGGGGVVINLHEAPGVVSEQRESASANGGRQVDIYQSMRGAAVDAYAAGDMDSAARARHGLARQLVNR